MANNDTRQIPTDDRVERRCLNHPAIKGIHVEVANQNGSVVPDIAFQGSYVSCDIPCPLRSVRFR